MVGKYLIEEIAKIPVEVDIASEFRYRNPLIDKKTTVIAISQSGETADTLAAMEEARKKGAKVWSIVNNIGSQVMRLADGYISMQVGPEIGVASTKAFTAPLIDLYLLAVMLADKKGILSKKMMRKLISDISKVPDLISTCLNREEDVLQVAKNLKDYEHILYLGRGINMPIAYEGALKLKEISYIHAEAYPAGEMKHGPIALIDKKMPVVFIATKDVYTYKKVLGNIQEVKARGGIVIAVATEGDDEVKNLADYVVFIPKTLYILSSVLAVIPLQLLAYYVATERGLDPD